MLIHIHPWFRTRRKIYNFSYLLKYAEVKFHIPINIKSFIFTLILYTQCQNNRYPE